jgi:hypothetical protein
VAAALAGGLITLAVGALAIWWFLRGGVHDDFRFLPDGSVAVGSLDVERLLRSPVVQELGLRPYADQFEEKTGLPAATLRRVTFGVGSGGAVVLVFRTSQPIDLKRILAKAEGSIQQHVVNGQQLYQDAVETIALVDPTTLIAGQPHVIKDVFERNQPPEFSGLLDRAIGQTDFSHMLAVAFSLRAGQSRPAVPWSLVGGPSSQPEEPPAESLSLYLDAGSTFTASARITCRDAQMARDFRKTIDDGLAKLREDPIMRKVAKYGRALTVRSRGDQVTLKLPITEAMIADLKTAFTPPSRPSGVGQGKKKDQKATKPARSGSE